jgi:glycosyltransferase involved in cell wall biosynthesis
MMRIVIVDPRGETRPYDDALGAALAARGNDVELVTSAPRVAQPPAPAGVAVRHAFYRLADRVPGGGRKVARGLEHPLDLLGLTPSLIRRRPDAIHVQWLPLGAVDRGYWRAIQGLLGVPITYTAHDALPNNPTPKRLRRAAANARAFGRVIVHSVHGRTALVEQLDVAPAHVHVVPHGALTAYREVAPTAPAVADGVPLVAMLGLLRPYKGLDILLDAWPAVRAAIPEAQLLVAGRVLGDPDGAARLERMAGEDLGVLADLRFTPTEEFVGAMLRADVVVLPYRRIDQSGVLFAALALGRPLVATRVGGFAEVVEQQGAGLVVPPEDPAALAEALIELLRDPARRTAMAAASRAAADGPFSWDAIAAATERVYAA